MGKFRITGIIASEEIKQEYADALQMVADGHYQGAHFKQLVGLKGIYTFRDTKQVRLIGFFYETYFIVIGDDMEHKLKKQPFSKVKNYINIYLEKNLTSIKKAIEDKNYISCVTPENINFIFSHPPTHPDYAPTHYYNKLWLELNAQQQGILRETLPLSIYGGAGSGKSFMALLMLKQLAVEEGLYLYITESRYLAESMEAMALDMDLDWTIGTIKFLTYEEYLVSYCGVDKDSIIGNAHLYQWLTDYCERYNTILKQLNKPSIFEFTITAEINQIIDEFRLRSVQTSENYLALTGDRQSKFINDTQKRLWLNNAYEAYQKALAFGKLVHSHYFKTPNSVIAKAIIYDEAQRAFLELQNTLRNSGGNLLILFDTLQGDSYLSIRPFVTSLISKPPINMEYTYRCPPIVLELANQVIIAKNMLRFGTADKGEPSRLICHESSNKAGSVQWVKSMDEIQAIINDFKETRQLVVAVMNRQQQILVKTDYPYLLVLTADELQGLQFQVVIVWHPYDTALFIEANRRLATLCPEKEKKLFAHRAKITLDNTELVAELNRFFTIITRSEHSLIGVQPYTHQNKHLFRLIHNLTPTINLEILPEIVIASTEDKLQQADALEKMGIVEQAQAIREQALNEPISEIAIETVNSSKNNATDRQSKNHTQVRPKKGAFKKRAVVKPKQTVQNTIKHDNEIFELARTELSTQAIQRYVQYGKNIERTLFLTSKKYPYSLFINIMKSTELKNTFAQSLVQFKPFKTLDSAKHFIQKLCTTDPLIQMPNLFWLVNTLAGQIALLTICLERTSLFKEFDDKCLTILYACDSEHTLEQKNKSVFYFLCELDSELQNYFNLLNIPNNGFLIPLLSHKLKTISLETLTQSIMVERAMTTPLSFLVVNNRVGEFLPQLFYKNNFYKKITPDRLFSTITDLPEGLSLFLLLCTQPQLLCILKEIFKIPGIHAACTAEILLKRIENYPFLSFSPLFSLTKNEATCDFLSSILHYSTKVITLSNLCEQFGKNSGNGIKISVFFSLSRHQTGCGVLQQLLDSNPELVNVPLDILFEPPEGGNEYENQTAFFNLCNHKIGLLILQKLIILNSEIAQRVTVPFLIKSQEDPLTKKKRRILTLLSDSITGQWILLKIFKDNPKLVKHIPSDIICHVHHYTEPSCEHDNLLSGSLFYQLTAVQPYGLKILNKLIEKNSLSTLTTEVLTQLVYDKNNKNHCSPLFYLSGNKAACNVLLNLLQKKPELINNSFLLQLFSEQTDKGIKLSCFYMLSWSNEGIEVIEFILEKAPNLYSLLTIERLFKEYSFKHSGNTNKTFLDHTTFRVLLSSPKGRIVLLALLRNNQELLIGIKAEKLSSLYGLSFRFDTIANHLQSLNDDAAVELLKLLKPSNNQTFFQPIQPRIARTGAVDPTQNEEMFFKKG